jgi:hypothetical protein
MISGSAARRTFSRFPLVSAAGWTMPVASISTTSATATTSSVVPMPSARRQITPGEAVSVARDLLLTTVPLDLTHLGRAT